jgi:hypothetical protein
MVRALMSGEINLRGLGYVVPQYAIDALRGEEAPPPVQPVRTTT